jgi:hypothetical protein
MVDRRPRLPTLFNLFGEQETDRPMMAHAMHTSLNWFVPRIVVETSSETVLLSSTLCVPISAEKNA